MAPIPGPILAKQESDIDIPSITPTFGLFPSKYSVTNEPNKNNITKISHAIRSLRLGDGTLLRTNGGRSYSRDAIDKVLDKTGIKLKSRV